MKTYDVTCPICGMVNHDLYLEETQGYERADRYIFSRLVIIVF